MATGQPLLLVIAGAMLVLLKYRRAVAHGLAELLTPRERPGYGLLSPEREAENREWRRRGGGEPLILGLLTLWAAAVLVVALLAFAGVFDALAADEP